MSSKLLKTIFVSTVFLSLSACSSLTTSSSTAQNLDQQERLYQDTKNYSALISLYREQLQLHQEPQLQYKLAKSYYLAGDSKSSLLYLEPLRFSQLSFNDDVELLYIRNQIQAGDYNEAYLAASDLVALSPKNSEAYNLRGISSAQLGKLADAEKDLNKSRELFIHDTIAINNLAMLSILNNDYKNAVNLLLPQYLNGSTDSRLIHNLVFALVKAGDTEYALDIIRKEKLNSSPEDLVNALKKTKKSPIVGH
ncbi:tetratricopeptide repeat protein [Actinobacillus equuli subsp. haemolyticus]|uniref:tetratricopeptide repeat protein n=1 Tax=Actinobacillus equuli TaxID=718 RepID=UPI0024416E57|nr:tetratricopeptide repeat protein [Actinobacillus equuli]WGE68163.1 tetratricopeptide repeat protein [Actinobacillus equuli subsp. haemolyticus]